MEYGPRTLTPGRFPHRLEEVDPEGCGRSVRQRASSALASRQLASTAVLALWPQQVPCNTKLPVRVLCEAEAAYCHRFVWPCSA